MIIFLPVRMCNDPQRKHSEVSAQRRTIQFLKLLNPYLIIDGSSLAKAEIPTLDEAIATMI